MFIRLQKTPANRIERYWIVDEIKKAIEHEAMKRGVMGDEIVSVTVGLDEYQFDIFESYSLSNDFSPLHFLCDAEGYHEDTNSYIVCFQWSETGFIDCDDENLQKEILKALKFKSNEIKNMIKAQDFIIYEAYDYANGKENTDEIISEILDDRYHPGGGIESVKVDGVWFVIERML